MDHAIFSMPTWAAIPPTNMIAWTKNAPILDVEGDIMAFAQVDNKFTTPYSWFIIPNSPTSQINKAGMCNILTPLIETSHFYIHAELFNCFPAEGHGDFPISVPVDRNQNFYGGKTE